MGLITEDCRLVKGEDFACLHKRHCSEQWLVVYYFNKLPQPTCNALYESIQYHNYDFLFILLASIGARGNFTFLFIYFF